MKLPIALVVTALMIFPVVAEETAPATKLPPPPDKEKLSYALGMNLGLQAKHNGVQPNVEVIAKAIKDVLEGKPTEIQESEIRMILKQAEAAGHVTQSSKNIDDGAAFLYKNAKLPGVTALPDGLQYKVITTGTGELPKRTDVLMIKFRGTWIDGAEFKHNDRLEIPFLGCTKGLQEAIAMMKVGSKWQIFIPYNLAYGRVGERAERFGSMLIYEVELLSAESESAHPNQHQGTGRVGHSLDEDVLPTKI